ncbi:putative reverse transcriptase domain-containing protein [Tanacetum coccineum]
MCFVLECCTVLQDKAMALWESEYNVGQCTIKCHKYGKVRHKVRYCKEKSVATGANTQHVWTCYDCGKQGHTRNRCPKRIKQEKVREVHGRVYAIKDAKPQGPNVVTGTFLLDIKPIKIEDSYKVELADGRIASVGPKYSKESGPKVVFRDDSSGDTKGYGSVNCNGITFTRVAYMNGLKHNLISISQLCDANYKVLFTKTQGTI